MNDPLTQALNYLDLPCFHCGAPHMMCLGRFGDAAYQFHCDKCDGPADPSPYPYPNERKPVFNTIAYWHKGDWIMGAEYLPRFMQQVMAARGKL